MRHGIAHRKFNRSTNQRKALLTNLANALIQHEHIVTTLPKAKDLRPVVEKLVTLGKNKEPLSGYRLAHSFLRDHGSCKKLIGPLAERHKERAGGYLRIIKAGFRYGDNAPMAVIEFVDYTRGAEQASESDKKSASSKSAAAKGSKKSGSASSGKSGSGSAAGSKTSKTPKPSKAAPA